MSAKLMSRVMEELSIGHAEQAVLVAMADHADDDGLHTFPSVSKIAWKTGYEVRNVQLAMRNLQQMGVLVLVEEAHGKRPAEYAIVLAVGPQKRTYSEWHSDRRKPRGAKSDEDFNGVQSKTNGVQSNAHGVQPAVNGVHPSAPRTLIEPYLETSIEPLLVEDSNSKPLKLEKENEITQGEKKEKTSGKKKEKSPRFSGSFEPRDLECATWMLKLLQQALPTIKKPDLEKWAYEIRLMRTSDGRSYEQIASNFKWARGDTDFWATNILGPGSLRRNFDKITAKANRKLSSGGSNGTNHNNAGRSPANRVTADDARRLAEFMGLAEPQ